MQRIVSTLYGIASIVTAIVEFKISSGFFTTLFFTVLGLLVWPIFWAVWLSRAILPVLRAHGILP